MTRKQALISIHLAAVLFGLTGIFGELIQSDALVITAGRAGFAVITLLGFMRWHHVSPVADLHRRSAIGLLVAGIMLAIHWVTFFIAVKVGGVAIATLGFASFPAFITLFEWLVLRERVRRQEWIVLGLVSSGLVLVTPSLSFDDQATVGLAWAIASGFRSPCSPLSTAGQPASSRPIRSHFGKTWWCWEQSCHSAGQRLAASLRWTGYGLPCWGYSALRFPIIYWYRA